MYSEWSSVTNEVRDPRKSRSVLLSYPPSVGRDVAKSIVPSLLAGSSTAHGSHSPDINVAPHFSSDTELKWSMEVVCFGLSLTLMEHDTLRDSVNVYIDWLSVLTIPKTTVPGLIKREPLHYVKIMFNHLQNLFIPRNDGNPSIQASLCQNVLRTIQDIALNSSVLDRESWESLLLFMLNICDVLLAAPAQQNGLAEQLCEHLMQTLLQTWLLSCNLLFPSPPLWKTITRLFSGWRHHTPVVEYWSRITCALTSKAVAIMHGPYYPIMKIPEEHLKYIPLDMQNENILQSWFRFLQMINNPVDLASASTISQNPRFFEISLSRDGVQDPSQHPCLSVLPGIFLKTMRGISDQIDGILGIFSEKGPEIVYLNLMATRTNQETPPITRKGQKNVSKKHQTSTNSWQGKSAVGSVPSSKSNTTSSCSTFQDQATIGINYEMYPSLPKDRPGVNSVLNLYGQWLFDCALAGIKSPEIFLTSRKEANKHNRGSSGIVHCLETSISQSIYAQQSHHSKIASVPDSQDIADSFDAGRSVAIGILCRIFSCKRTGEHILPIFYSRFYLAVGNGLVGNSYKVLASILLNSVKLFSIDHPGVTCLLPAMLSALETILPDKELDQYKPHVNIAELRHSSILLLLSMIPLAFHNKDVPVKDIQSLWIDELDGSNETSTNISFSSFKLRMIQQLIGALQCETYPSNTQMILGGMLMTLQYFTLFESSERTTSKLDNLGYSNNGSITSDTSFGFFVSCVCLVSQKLHSSKSELGVSLAALEVLRGLAKVKTGIADSNECHQAVYELCHYIVSQCERPPPQHKRELHSMIVAAFHTLTTWLLEHPYLLDEKNCLNEVLETIELGISGKKSSPPECSGSERSRKANLKGEKDLAPASKRVLEAAEGALLCVFEHLGSFPSLCSPSSTCSLLNELCLVEYASRPNGFTSEHFNSTSKILPEKDAFSNAVKQFKYFVTGNMVLLGILQQGFANEKEPAPTVTLIVRSGGGRKAYSLRFRQTTSGDEQSPHLFLDFPARPNFNPYPGFHCNVYHRTFPAEVECIPLVKADCSIPLLSEVADEELSDKVKRIKLLMEKQKQYDLEVERQLYSSHFGSTSLKLKECTPPEPHKEFQTARLLLSHLNLLSLNSIKQLPQQRIGPELAILNEMDQKFSLDLQDLDSIPVRNADTVFIFYQKVGQTKKKQILNNASSNCSDLHPEFMDFLLSLGWPVELTNHPGWSGHIDTSWKLNYASVSSNVLDLDISSPGIFNGEKHVLYYADVQSEVAFIVPTGYLPGSLNGFTDSTADEIAINNLHLDLNSVPNSRSINNMESPGSPTESPTPFSIPKVKKIPATAKTNLHQIPDCRVAVVWTESYDEITCFPLEDLVSEMHTGQKSGNLCAPSRKDILCIYIYPLQSGLFRITVDGQSSIKSGVALPLVHGAVVSLSALGSAVRLTASNMCHRRRLDSDLYSPPHVKRKHRIAELLAKYKRRCTEPEFFTALYTE